MNDPRIYFAAERTFLAWTRTGITLLAFGLVVVRFGLIQEWIDKNAAHATNVHSLVVGGALWLTALVIQAVSLRQFLVYRATLPADQVPPGASSVLPWVVTLVLTAVCGGLLLLVS
jgi:putative membrane protein